ncbi:MAG: hypothetical protein ACLFPQ_02245 [Candidatus Woesearchaeota archaeon]
MKVYCDTCVYMDAMGLNENNDPLRPLDEFAWNFFNAVKEGDYILVTSSWLFEEFKKVVGDDNPLIDFVDDLKLQNKIHITETYDDKRKAGKLSSSNFPDARHVILAEKAGAMILTTQNFRDFAEFKDYLDKHSIELIPPESL